ncbi:aminoacylase-1A isoform X2 [Hyalella azteca]|uniref:N-acyl-aliphatic-L-amino acid amidohydrolase n=1 Tax=Hyalella azteca TaxID=294128 RepID=A0A979FTB8_HYAAZ|nr:aminoacylase-1A isoform X2 [Hyalella azteca]
MAENEDPAVTRFREYIRINTMQPNPDYEKCTAWLKARGEAVGGEVRVVESAPGKPVVLITFKGTDPRLPSLLLNSHTDVVPVFPEHWKYDPFSATKDENGDIYGRGTQDMKCVGAQYLEAINRMRKQGKTFLRTIHLSFVPEEEIGGVLGMKEFVKMPEFEELNVGFALDEGYANPSEKFSLFYAERTVWWVMVHCRGQPGHGSQFLKKTAGEKLRKMINSFLAFRNEQEQKLLQNPDLQLGDVTSVNLTMLQGGVQFNVVPAELSVGFDIRIPPTVDLTEFVGKIAAWCKEAGDDVTFEFKQKMMNQDITCVEDGKCSWWDAFNGACKEEKLDLVKTIFPAATDSSFLREVRASVIASPAIVTEFIRC